jgi:hypothetical protein
VLALATAEAVAFIGAGATILAAIILGGWAAWAADRRQARQIADSGQRQARELAAEGERQRATLAHDRELADLHDLRALLDEAAVAVQRGKGARETAEGAVLAARLGKRESIEDGVSGLEGASVEIYSFQARLKVRLGGIDDTVEALGEAAGHLRTMGADIALAAVTKNVGEATEAKAQEEGTAFTVASVRFFEAARHRAGASVPAIVTMPG